MQASSAGRARVAVCLDRKSRTCDWRNGCTISNMRFVSIVLVLAACGEVRQNHRWPDHRREKDEAIHALELKSQSLEQKTATLETALRELEQELAKLRQPVAPQAPATALPSPGT